MAHDRGSRCHRRHLGPHLSRRRAGRRRSRSGSTNPRRRTPRTRSWGVTTENLIPYTQRGADGVPPRRAGGRCHPVPHARRVRPQATEEMRRLLAGRLPARCKQDPPHIRCSTCAPRTAGRGDRRRPRLGVNLRITTKYWMEQMGLPFHPTHVNPQDQHNRRHGYADLLRYPAALQDALAAVERRHHTGAALGRPGICAPLRREDPLYDGRTGTSTNRSPPRWRPSRPTCQRSI